MDQVVAREGMIRLEGGAFRMGSDAHYPEEAPERSAQVGAFWIDQTPVTNQDFARFVEQTGYVTVAERIPDPALYPGLDPSLAVPASLVFTPPDHPVSLRNVEAWWRLQPGANWRAPAGPGSDLSGLDRHPVVHVAYEDAAAYAAWAGKALPTEAEWEYAARGGLEGVAYAWGDELAPGGVIMANIWHGEFPWENLAPHGFTRTSPVRSFAANGFGLFDMIGNVWEWIADEFKAPREQTRACCAPQACPDEAPIARRVLKGGSHLCAANYCRRYRPAARLSQSADTSTSHVGFRCVVREPWLPDF